MQHPSSGKPHNWTASYLRVRVLCRARANCLWRIKNDLEETRYMYNKSFWSVEQKIWDYNMSKEPKHRLQHAPLPRMLLKLSVSQLILNCSQLASENGRSIMIFLPTKPHLSNGRSILILDRWTLLLSWQSVAASLFVLKYDTETSHRC